MKQSVLSDLDAKLFKKYNLFRFHTTLVDKLKTILEFNLWREGFDHKQQKSAFLFNSWKSWFKEKTGRIRLLHVLTWSEVFISENWESISTQKNVEKYHQSIQDSAFGHKINKDHLYLAEKSYTGHINIQWVCD